MLHCILYLYQLLVGMDPKALEKNLFATIGFTFQRAMDYTPIHH